MDVKKIREKLAAVLKESENDTKYRAFLDDYTMLLDEVKASIRAVFAEPEAVAPAPAAPAPAAAEVVNYPPPAPAAPPTPGSVWVVRVGVVAAALGAVGLNTDFKALCKSGAKPMLHGFIISLLVVLVAIGVEYMLGIAPTGNLF